MSRVDAYTGKDGSWREWSFQFRVAVKAMEASTAEILGKVEQDDKAHDITDLELEYSELDIKNIAGELYDVLCLCLKGDPLVLVQSVISMTGFEARVVLQKVQPCYPCWCPSRQDICNGTRQDEGRKGRTW